MILVGEENQYQVKIKNKKYKNTKLLIYVTGSQNLEYGDEISFEGEFSSPQECTNYKGFDQKEYFKTLEIYGSVKVQSLEVIAKNKGNFLIHLSKQLAKKMKQKIQESSILEEEKSLLEGILLGDKTNLSEETISNFSASNMAHILAVSGMHVSYLLLFSNFLLNRLVGKHYAKIISSIIIFIYMSIVNFTPSVVRAGITGIIAILAHFFYRKNDSWETLSLALLILFMENPFAIKNIGLQLSFAGTIGMIVFPKTLKKWAQSLLERNERRAIRKNKKFTRYFLKMINSKVGKFLQDSMITTISALIMVTPIMLVHFNQVGVVSIIISILASFIIGPIIILGIIFMISKIGILEMVLKYILQLLINMANLGSNLPLNQIYLITPGIVSIIFYYSLIFLFHFILKLHLEKNPDLFQMRVRNLVSFSKYKIKQRKKKIFSIVVLCSVFIFVIFMIPKNLKIYFVDVGQGDCSLIVTPRNHTILIDGGGKEKSDFDVR